VTAAARFEVSVPGSTANLGSGFDALGMALDLRDVVGFEVVDGPAGSARVAVDGQGARGVPTDERHLVVRMAHRALAELGVPAPALRLDCRNAIPHSRGLGSSAAAIVAGIAAGHELAGQSLRGAALDHAVQLAASVEGHADNAAASLLGGLVIAWSEGQRFRATRLEPHAQLHPVALVPDSESSTHTTRGLLPERIPHADGVFAAGRAALAVHALTSAPELLLAATEDRLHQDYRESAWPGSVALVRRLRAAGVPAAISGAGPTVLALPETGELPAGVDLDEFSARGIPVDREGVVLNRFDT
jgi:homoserine kinase